MLPLHASGVTRALLLPFRTWPDLEHLSRMLARMPNLKVVDLTKLGADPTGYNSLEQIVELLAARPQLVDLRLGAHALPVLRAKQQSFGSSEAGKLHLRVRLPQSLALLKALQTLHLRRECCLGPDYKKLDLAMEAGGWHLPQKCMLGVRCRGTVVDMPRRL